MACFEWNLHTQICSGDSILCTTFCGYNTVDTTFYSMTHYYITIVNDIAKDVHCDIIMSHEVVMYAYNDVTMHTDVTRTLIYYVLLQLIMIVLFY